MVGWVWVKGEGFPDGFLRGSDIPPTHDGEAVMSGAPGNPPMTVKLVMSGAPG